MSCTFKKGDTVRVTGGNGSGKSTFFKLLSGMYAIENGNIELNDKPVSCYSHVSLNEQILYINQDDKCLNETMNTYIRTIASRTISDEELNGMLASVELEGSGSISGNGASLSGGQRKKLYIMKLIAAASRASVILLDEVTAGLDAETTDKFYALLDDIAEKDDRIMFFVEHTEGKSALYTKTLEFDGGNVEIRSDI